MKNIDRGFDSCTKVPFNKQQVPAKVFKTLLCPNGANRQQPSAGTSFKKAFCFVLAAAAMLLLLLQPAAAQSVKPQDSLKTAVSDSLLPGLVMKVASYAATIDHTDFLIRRKFDLTPIAVNMPEMERKVKGFKTRLEKRGRQMNLRSLNSGVIMLNEISQKLTTYQEVLNNFSTELAESNAEVKKILRDPALQVRVSDSMLLEQMQDLQLEGRKLDVLQQKTLAKVNLLRNKVSINLLQASDIISDMRYLTISLKMGMWKQEEAPLLKTSAKNYHNDFLTAATTALQRSGLIISIYVGEKWNVLTLGLVIFLFSFLWTGLNIRGVKKQPNAEGILAPVLFLKRSVLVGCLLAFFTYVPFLFVNPPMSLLHTCEVLRLGALSFLIFPFLTRPAKMLWGVLSVLWLGYALDDLLLESTLGERWNLFFYGLLLALLCLRIMSNKKPLFVRLAPSTATKAVAIFALTQVVLSLIFNLSGRVSLAKIFGVSAVQCLVLAMTLKMFCTLVLEAIYLQSEAYRESRFAQFINFKTLQHRFLRALWVVAITAWTVSLIRNLTLYDVMLRGLDSFFNQTRTIGSMVFTFKSVAVFIFILWLSSVISGLINFFLGHENAKSATGRSRLGSMRLLIRLTIWTLGFFIAVAAAGIPLEKLSLMLGALGVGIGFGLQNIVNNLVSGVIIAFERPIQIGDLIEVGGKMGVVKEIGVRSSKINNNEGADIIVPNGDLLSQHLINWTMQDRNKKVEFVLNISYRTDVKNIVALIKDTLGKNEKIMETPGPSIVVHQFGEKAIHLKISFWVYDLAEAGSIRTQEMIEIHELLAQLDVQQPVYNGEAAKQDIFTV